MHLRLLTFALLVSALSYGDEPSSPFDSFGSGGINSGEVYRASRKEPFLFAMDDPNAVLEPGNTKYVDPDTNPDFNLFLGKEIQGTNEPYDGNVFLGENPPAQDTYNQNFFSNAESSTETSGTYFIYGQAPETPVNLFMP